MTRRRLIGVLAILAALLVAGYFIFPGAVFRLARRTELRVAGLEEHGIDVAGHHIEYLSGGTGDPVVLLHGFGADKSNWVRVARYLVPHFRVVAPDLPGFGESTRDLGARYSVSDQVERVRAFVQALGLSSIHIGGNSMGGQIAGVYAARYQDDTESLWLLDPGGVASAEPSELQVRLSRGEANPLFVSDAESFDKLLDFVFVERPYIPRPIVRYLAERAVASRSFNEKILADLRSEGRPLEDVLDELGTSTLIVWGDQDRLCHVSGAKILKSRMPNADVVILKGVGHIPMVERPQETADAYLRFQGVK